MSYTPGEPAPRSAPGSPVAAGAGAIGRVALPAGISGWFGATPRGDNVPVAGGAGGNIRGNVAKPADPGEPQGLGDCRNAAGALIAGGKAIPAGSLAMGAPGRAARAPDAGAIAGPRRGAHPCRRDMHRFCDPPRPV